MFVVVSFNQGSDGQLHQHIIDSIPSIPSADELGKKYPDKIVVLGKVGYLNGHVIYDANFESPYSLDGMDRIKAAGILDAGTYRDKIYYMFPLGSG